MWGGPPGPPTNLTPTTKPTAEQTTSLQQRLHAALVESGHQYTADAVEHSSIEDNGTEVVITTPKSYTLSIKGPEVGQTLTKLLGRPAKVKLTTGDPAPSSGGIVKKAANADEAQLRALDNTEVKRFQELFPGSEVRQVRDLSDY